jgi:hypothetical protein
MPINIQHIPVEYVAQTWPLVESHVASAEKFGGDDYTTDQIKVYLAKGLWQLFAAVNEENVVQGAATVLFQNYPNDRVAFVTTMGGNMMVNEEVLSAFKQTLKGFGATKLQGAMRPSMVRLSEKLGFVERYAIVEVKI